MHGTKQETSSGFYSQACMWSFEGLRDALLGESIEGSLLQGLRRLWCPAAVPGAAISSITRDEGRPLGSNTRDELMAQQLRDGGTLGWRSLEAADRQVLPFLG